MNAHEHIFKTDAERFRECWCINVRSQLQFLDEGIPPEASAWEGQQAAQELSKNGNLWLLLPDPSPESFPFFQLTEKLSREAFFYKTFCDLIQPTNLRIKQAITAISAAAAKLSRASAKNSQNEDRLQVDLNRCSTQLQQTVDSLKKRQKTYWEESLLALPEERMSWGVSLDDLSSHPPAELAEYETIFDKAKYPRQLVKRIDLDTRFQIKAAVILRLYLAKEYEISLRTISRLVALTYLAGELAREKEESLLLAGRKRPITVSGIDQKIRAAGLK